MNGILFCFDFLEQRPWSEWGRTNESCLQHTGHDTEQVQQLYSMCEQLLIDYCYHRNKEYPNSTSTTYLSPMNLLVVTLWYLRHYHAERYIATELDLNPSTVHHMLSKVIDILHSSVPANMADKNLKHGPEEHHKLIVDSNVIAIPEPNDSQQRKAYYHSKNATN
jgi:hypothetical protein